MDLISKLGIDVKLILAQVVNFLILLFVLKKLVYKPLLDLFDKRKKMIEKSVEDTRKIEEKLLAIEKDKENVLADASKKAVEIMETAKKDAAGEREKTLEAAKKEISGLAERYRAQLKADEARMLKDIKKEVAALIVQSCEKILRKEYDKSDQARIEEAIKNEIAGVKFD